MLARLSIVAGLVAGVLVAALVIGGILAFAPVSTPSSPPLTAPPSVRFVTPAPTTAPSPTAGPSAAPPSGSPGASDVPASSASAAAGDQPFHIGEAAPALVLPKVGGGTIDLRIGADGVIRTGAAGGIGPDTMATGLQSILPGIDISP